MNLSGQDAREKEQVFLSHLSNLLDASPLEPPTKKRRSMNEVITRICDDNQAGTDGAKSCVRPWSYEDFIQRARTFKASTWFAKPSLLSPLECARYGWINIGPDRLECSSCRVTLVHSDDTLDHSAFHGQLNASHEKYCGWFDNPCSATYCDFPSADIDEIRSSWRDRTLSFVRAFSTTSMEKLFVRLLDWSTVQTRLPKSQLDVEAQARISDILEVAVAQSENVQINTNYSKFLSDLTSDSIKYPINSKIADNNGDSGVNIASPQLINIAVLLSAFGWQMTKAQMNNSVPESQPHDSNPSLLFFCRVCGQQSEVNDSADDTRSFNPISDHRFFCPWTKKTSPEKQCGFEVCIKAILEDHSKSANLVDNSVVSDTNQKISTADIFNRIHNVISNMSEMPFEHKNS